jgi:putative lipoprotein
MGRAVRLATAAGAKAALLTTVSVLFVSGPARAADPDPWFGRDKALHFGASAAIASAGYGTSALFSEKTRVRLATGAVLGLGAGVAKELWDLSGHGDASWRDLTWDLAGTVTGLALAAAIDWTISKLSAPRAASQHGRTPAPAASGT